MGEQTERLTEYLDAYFGAFNDPQLKEQARRAIEANLESNLQLIRGIEALSADLATKRNLPEGRLLASSVRAQVMVGMDYFEKLTRLNSEFAERLLSAIRRDLNVPS